MFAHLIIVEPHKAEEGVAAEELQTGPLFTFDDFKEFKRADMERVVAKIVVPKSKGRNSVWGFTKHKPIWWPEYLPKELGGGDVKFVAPKARDVMTGKPCHNKASLSTICMAYLKHYLPDLDMEADSRMASSPVDLTLNSGNDDEPQSGLLGGLNGITIYQVDIQSLAPGIYVTDAIVNACLMKPNSRRQITMYLSHWSIPGLGNISPAEPLSPGLHIFPTCMSSHWWLIAFDNRNPKMPFIYTIDSLFTGGYPLERHTDANEKLACHLRCKFAKNKICKVSQQRPQSNDCAIHVIHNAWTLMKLGPNGLQSICKRSISTSRTDVLEYITNNVVSY